MTNKAYLGRFDGEIKQVAFNDGDNVQSLLDKLSLSLATGEGINDDNGEDVSPTALAKDGETYYIVGNYKQA